MEQLPLVFNQSVIEPEIQECFEPAFNFTKINSSNGRLAFTQGKIYWLPDAPMAMLDQGWVIKVSEIASYGKFGLAGFSIKLVDGKELRFSNVGGKMRDAISEAIEDHKGDKVEEGPLVATDAPAGEASPAAGTPAEAPAEAPVAPLAADITPEDASSNKLMGILAYLGILVLIPLFAAKDSKFARFHVNQGLILLICSVVIYAVGRVLGLSTLAGILNIAVFILAVIGIVNVVKGRAKELPLVGKFRIIS